MKRQFFGSILGTLFFLGLFAAMIFSADQSFAQTVGDIYTIAGNGTRGYTGDGSAATSAEIVGDYLAYDPSGNLYISDHINHVIRKVNTSGTITTFAGTGTAGYTGDGGSALSAEINFPTYMACDPAGNLYFTDLHAYVVRKINTSGTISTFAGTGTQASYLGQGDGSSATSAQLYAPTGLATDSSGNLYIADLYYVRKVNTSGVISSYAPSTDFYGSFPYLGGIWMDASNNLFVSNTAYPEVTKVTSGGSASIIAGTGIPGYSGDGFSATSATLDYPTDVVTDSAGNIFIDDFENHVIRKVDTSGVITTYAGNGYGAGTNFGGYNGDGIAATSAELYTPQGVRLDSAGNVVIADYGNNRIRQVYEHAPLPIQYRPSAYSDAPAMGDDPTNLPTGPYVYTGSNQATVQSYTNFVYDAGNYDDEHAEGDCTWSGFPSHVDSNDLTLHIPYHFSYYYGPGEYWVKVAMGGGSPSVISTGFFSNGSGTISTTVPAGTDLSTIQVEVIVDAYDDQSYNPSDDSTAAMSLDLYVQ